MQNANKKKSPKSALLSYQVKKEKLIADIKKCRENGRGNLSLYKSTSNLFRRRSIEKNSNKIDVRSFNQVISIDKENLIAEVEGMTTYEDFVNATLQHSCLPTVVPELKSITVGGAISGCGIESSSFRYGLVHETINEIEVLLSDGQVITCTPFNEHHDLFFAFPNSFGTLGYAIKIKVQLQPAKKYVKLEYLPFSDPQLYFKELNRLCLENRKGGKSFIDGVIFDQNHMFITLGEFVDEAPYQSNYRYRNIYYRSIQSRGVDYLSTFDYIWRWDPDWFWCSNVFWMQNPIPRFLFGKWMLSSKVYTRIMHYFDKYPSLVSFFNSFRKNQESIIQDVLIPIESASDFLDFFQKEIGIKPIWICPSHSYSTEYKYDFCPLDPNVTYIDFGFWDSIPSDQKEGYYNKKIEEVSAKFNGFKSLYSDSYYTEQQFWTIYDHSKYLNIKQTYDPLGLLPSLYAKVHPNK